MADLGLGFDIGQQIGGVLGNAYAGYKQGEQERFARFHDAALAHFNAGDHKAANDLANLYLQQRGLPAAGLTQTPGTPGTPALAPQGPTPSGAPLAPIPAVPAVAPKIDYDSPENVAAIAGVLGVPRPAPTGYMGRNGEFTVMQLGYPGQAPTVTQPINAPERPTSVPQGSVAINGKGGVLYNNPKPDRPTIVPAGGVAVDPQGNPLASNPKPLEPKVVGAGGVLMSPTGTPLGSAPPKPPTERAPRLVANYNADGTVTMVPATPGLVLNPKTPASAVKNDGQLMDEAKRMFGSPYPVEAKDRHGRPTGQAAGMDGVSIEQARESWRQGVQTIADALKAKQGKSVGGVLGQTQRTSPFGQSGGQVPGAGATFRPGAASGSPIPVSYNDTQLLPQVESDVQAGLAAFPGSSITSRARSVARNAAAGGVGDSSHLHRAAFDWVSGGKATDAAVRKFYESRGYRVLGPGDPGGEAGHLHIDKRSLFSAVPEGDGPKLAALYKRYGVDPTAGEDLLNA